MDGIQIQQEEQKLLEAAQQEIDDEFVKNNGEVREKAEIRKNYQEGAVSADWEFEPYDVVDDEGRVVEENIPENNEVPKIYRVFSGDKRAEVCF